MISLETSRSSTRFPLWKRSQSIRKVRELEGSPNRRGVFIPRPREQRDAIKVCRSACKRARRRVSALDSANNQSPSPIPSRAAQPFNDPFDPNNNGTPTRLICIIAGYMAVPVSGGLLKSIAMDRTFRITVNKMFSAPQRRRSMRSFPTICFFRGNGGFIFLLGRSYGCCS